jgi:hypothetical protein
MNEHKQDVLNPAVLLKKNTTLNHQVNELSISVVRLEGICEAYLGIIEKLLEGYKCPEKE